VGLPQYVLLLGLSPAAVVLTLNLLSVDCSASSLPRFQFSSHGWCRSSGIPAILGHCLAGLQNGSDRCIEVLFIVTCRKKKKDHHHKSKLNELLFKFTPHSFSLRGTEMIVIKNDYRL
jgi:hypothetical protein